MYGGFDPLTEPEQEQPPQRGALYAVYATAFFSLSLVPMTALVVPLWALSLGASPSQIGVVVAARSVLPFFLSIHGGAMMDRLGTRRLMLVFTGAGAALSLLYPLVPRIEGLIALQLAIGWAQGMGWIGAQTKIARLTRGNTAHAGYFSFYTTLGTSIAPLVGGAAWDAFGPWGAFVTIALWGAALSAATYRLPVPPAGQDRFQQWTWREVLPQPSDYVRAFALLAIPGVALVVAATFLRIAAFSVQGSFYTVYLEGIGLSGTQIGTLVGIAALIGGPAALLTGPLVRFVAPHWLLLVSVAISIVFVCITPLLPDFTALLIAAAIFGLGLGIGLPLMLSGLSEAISAREQGVSVGLRTTANRLASIVIPVLMGFVIERVGIEYGFLVVGVMLLAILGITAWVVHRSPAFARTQG